MKILNLYAGLGGNSNNWDDTEHEITNVELDAKIAALLQERKPRQKVIVVDAHEYLLANYKEYEGGGLYGHHLRVKGIQR